ncbi:MAG: ATP-binding cassette domain-containing protein, partial [Flavobacteriales bacterium]|nr:ATP-binding cassette domain-containing protein [Flavobacteriales bacterium]
MIKVQNLDFSYQKGEKIIDNLSFNVPKNSIFGFLGANGSGKTTAIRLLLNLCKPNNGEVIIQNKKISLHSLELYKNIGTLIESPTFYGHLSG